MSVIGQLEDGVVEVPDSARCADEKQNLHSTAARLDAAIVDVGRMRLHPIRCA